MSLREDVKYEIKTEWHPKVPNEQKIIKQIQGQLRKGKSSGSIALDLKAIREKEEGR